MESRGRTQVEACHIHALHKSLCKTVGRECYGVLMALEENLCGTLSRGMPPWPLRTG